VPGDGHETGNEPCQGMLHVEITFQSGSGSAKSHLHCVIVCEDRRRIEFGRNVTFVEFGLHARTLQHKSVHLHAFEESSTEGGRRRIMSSPAGAATANSRRKGANPNKDPDLIAEKKEKKAERDALAKRRDVVKAASWKYGLGCGGVFIGCLCLYSLVTISRASITTVQLDDAAQLKEASSHECVASPPSPLPLLPILVRPPCLLVRACLALPGPRMGRAARAPRNPAPCAPCAQR